MLIQSKFSWKYSVAHEDGDVAQRAALIVFVVNLCTAHENTMEKYGGQKQHAACHCGI